MHYDNWAKSWLPDGLDSDTAYSSVVQTCRTGKHERASRASVSRSSAGTPTTRRE